MSGYLMESRDEGARLAAKTDRALVAEELALTGLSSGARALDAGCASGVITQAMVERVGGAGSVVGVDLSRDRLREAAERNKGRARFAHAALEHLPFPDGSFDYVLCRLVLEYAQKPRPIVDELARVCAPGGRVVLVDVDGYGAFHHPLEGERAEAVGAISKLLEKAGFDAFVGRKLYGLARAAGLTDVHVHLRPYHVIAGEIAEEPLRNWRYKLETLAPLGRRALGEARYDRYAEVLIEMLRDPETFSYSVLMLVEGRRRG